MVGSWLVASGLQPNEKHTRGSCFLLLHRNYVVGSTSEPWQTGVQKRRRLWRKAPDGGISLTYIPKLYFCVGALPHINMSVLHLGSFWPLFLFRNPLDITVIVGLLISVVPERLPDRSTSPNLQGSQGPEWDMGLSENRVPLNPWVNHHFPYNKCLFWGTIFRQTHILSYIRWYLQLENTRYHR
jgi:hypothetical protein